jgi:hypothetical protein
LSWARHIRAGPGWRLLHISAILSYFGQNRPRRRVSTDTKLAQRYWHNGSAFAVWRPRAAPPRREALSPRQCNYTDVQQNPGEPDFYQAPMEASFRQEGSSRLAKRQ